MKDELIIKNLYSIIKVLEKEVTKKDKELSKLYNTFENVKDMVDVALKTDFEITRSKKELELIFDVTDGLVVVLDKDYIIKRVNKCFCSFVKKPYINIIGTMFEDYFPDLPESFKKIDLKEETFVKTKFFSTFYHKHFLIKSRRLNKEHDPLVYVHITNEIISMEGGSLC